MAAYTGFMTHITFRLTAKNQDQLRDPTLGNRVWATFTFIYKAVIDRRLRPRCCHLGSYFSARKVVLCVRQPATGIIAHNL